MREGYRVLGSLSDSLSIGGQGLGLPFYYSGLNLNQDKARQRRTGLNLIHYILCRFFS